MTTVRDLIHSVQREMLETADLTPDRASELLNQATALLGNVLDELRSADAEYRLVLLAHLRAHAKANRAKIEAAATPQFKRLQEAKDTLRLTEQMMISLRAFLRTKESEMKYLAR